MRPLRTFPHAQVGQAAAQTTFNTTIGFFDATPILVYGQKQAYRLGLPTPLTQSATPPTAGTATYINGTASPLAAFALSAGQFNPQCTNTNCQNVRLFRPSHHLCRPPNVPCSCCMTTRCPSLASPFCHAGCPESLGCIAEQTL